MNTLVENTGIEVLEKHAKIMDLFRPYEDFSRCLLDAFVIIDPAGKPVHFNTLFSQLTGLKAKKISRIDTLTEILQLTIGQSYLTVEEIFSYDTPTRIDEISGITNDKGYLNLIVGIYPLIEAGKTLGCFMLLRDVTAETALQGKYKSAAQRSVTDPLTSLFTRGYFEDYLSLQTRTLLEVPLGAEERAISLVMIDIDHFKKVNDTHGHQAGDHILKVVAEIIKKSFRKSDICCRYGGEEFLVILPATDLDGSFRAAEKLRTNIETQEIVFDNKTIPITISGGIAKIKIGSESHKEALGRADKALYKAKEQGRNRIKIAH